jgi:hypothetical protein
MAIGQIGLEEGHIIFYTFILFSRDHTPSWQEVLLSLMIDHKMGAEDRGGKELILRRGRYRKN